MRFKHCCALLYIIMFKNLYKKTNKYFKSQDNIFLNKFFKTFGGSWVPVHAQLLHCPHRILAHVS